MLRFSFFTLLLVILISSFPSFAEDGDIQKRPEILEVNLSQLESAGLYSSSKDGSLGRDLWNKSPRSALEFLIPKLPQPGTSPTLQKLVFGILLSSANARLIDNDYDKKEISVDLLTLRLEKLIELGAYTYAFELYSLLNAEPYHPRLARAGILSMLYNGEKSLACLEYNTVQDRDFSGKFWNNVKLYCDYLLNNKKTSLKKASAKILSSIGKSKDYIFSYNASGFSKLSDLERAVLVAEKRIKLPKLSSSALRKLPNAHASIFLNLDLSDTQRFFTTAHAVSVGLISRQTLSNFYTSIYDSHLRTLDDAPNKGWQRLAYYFSKAKKTKNRTKRWNIILNALELRSKYPDSAFIPFSSLMHNLPINQLSLPDINTIIKIRTRAGDFILRPWAKHLSTIQDLETNHPKLALFKHLEIPSYKKSSDDADKIDTALKHLSSNAQTVYFNFMKNIDRRHDNMHNHDEIYEKDFYLTDRINYVMPTQRVWDRLKSSSQNEQIGEAVLLSTLLLSEQKPKDIYPSVVRDVLEFYTKLGLINISKSFIYELILNNK